MTDLVMNHIDTCLPCYFLGCAVPNVQVPVDGDTTFLRLKDGITYEIHSGYVSGKSDAVDYTAMLEAVRIWFEDKDETRLFDASLERQDDDSSDYGESAYAYFSFTEK